MNDFIWGIKKCPFKENSYHPIANRVRGQKNQEIKKSNLLAGGKKESRERGGFPH